MNLAIPILYFATDAAQSDTPSAVTEAFRRGQEDMRKRAAKVANDGALATEDDGIAAWIRDRILALAIKEKDNE